MIYMIEDTSKETRRGYEDWVETPGKGLTVLELFMEWIFKKSGDAQPYVNIEPVETNREVSEDNGSGLELTIELAEETEGED